jgi:hypothetical protein
MQKQGTFTTSKESSLLFNGKLSTGQRRRELYLNFPVRIHAVLTYSSFTITLPHINTYSATVVLVWLTIPEGSKQNMIENKFMS